MGGYGYWLSGIAKQCGQTIKVLTHESVPQGLEYEANPNRHDTIDYAAFAARRPVLQRFAVSWCCFLAAPRIVQIDTPASVWVRQNGPL